jgi:hypothetical protein
LDADSPSPVFRTGCVHKLGAEKSNTSFYLRLPQAVKDHRPFEPEASQILQIPIIVQLAASCCDHLARTLDILGVGDDDILTE